MEQTLHFAKVFLGIVNSCKNKYYQFWVNDRITETVESPKLNAREVTRRYRNGMQSLVSSYVLAQKNFNWPAFVFRFEFKPRFDEIFHILQEPNETRTGLNRLAGLVNEKRHSFLWFPAIYKLITHCIEYVLEVHRLRTNITFWNNWPVLSLIVSR